MLSQCSNQLVQAVGEVQNFSLSGVLIIVCVSVAIILLDWSLEGVFDLCSRPDSAARDARQADNKLHLLRRVLDSEGSGGKR